MRYLPHTDGERRRCWTPLALRHIAALFADVPASKLLKELPDLPRAKSEMAVERALSALAARNVAAGSVPFFAGCGAYKHHVPATVDHVIQRSEFLTAYTPYQPEIAQGTLQYMFEFQSQVALLTGMEVANASMYDGSTAAAEAVLMAHRVTKRKKAVLAGGLHPHYRAVIETISRYSGHGIEAGAADPAKSFEADCDKDTSCIVVQMPDVFGRVADLSGLAEKAHAAGALLVVVVTEAVSFGALKSPGAMGADIVVAEGQSIGNGLNFGGPYLGLFATRQKFVRQMPGRLCGQTLDRDGQARLRADALHPRAAHPPREGHQQHLHKLRPVRAGVHGASDAARRGGPAQARGAEPRRRSDLGGYVGAGAWRRAGHAAVLQRVHHQDAQARRGGHRGACGSRRDRRRAREQAVARRCGA